MDTIIIFGAGGKAGRAAVAEARRRGHQVTAVVRDPAKYPDLNRPGVTVVAGDVTDPHSIATLAVGHDAAVSAVHDPTVAPDAFYASAAEALVGGLANAGVGRLVVIGIGTVLEVAPGVAVHDTEGFPAEGRTFSLGHAAGLKVLRSLTTDVDWLVVAPPPIVLDDRAERTGRYRIGGVQVLPDVTAISYADLAVAVLDQIDEPTFHRELVAVG
jgi:putative NADH-flavin reductase